MTPEEIRNAWGREIFKRSDDVAMMLSVIAEIMVEQTAQWAELNEKFFDFFATQEYPKKIQEDDTYQDYKRRREDWKEYLENKEK